MKAKTYELLAQCVGEGVDSGVAYAYKHNDMPSQEHIKQQVERAVMLKICEWFTFEENE